MCSGAAFLVGLFLLFRGPFRVANRSVPRPLSRRIALILMTPVVIGGSVGVLIGFNSVGMPDDSTLLRLAMVEIIALVVAVGIVLYLIYKLPMDGAYAPSAPMPVTSAPPPFVPRNVMTPAETAVYLHISEAQVRELIDGGQLPAARMNNDYVIARIAIDDFLNHNKADDSEDFSEFKN